MLRRYIAAFAVLSFLIAPVEARLRFWTHAATKTRVQAELLEIKGQKIRILNPKGAQATIAIDQLSDADQQYLKKLVSQEKAAEEAFKLGVDALKSGRYEEAKERFLKASKWNERDIKADFALGIYYIGYERKIQDAGEHFEVCVERWKSRIPQFTNIERVNYIAALNNSALVHVRRRQLDLAFQEWQTAIDIGHVTPQEIIQNLGTVARFATNVTANVTAFDVPLNQEERDGFKQLIQTAVLPKDSKPYRPDVGWLYMTYMDESDLSDRANDADDDELRTVGYTTGFVIADGWILTNRHSVVKDDEVIPYDGFEAFFGPAYDQPVRVTLEDADSKYDLALLKFEPNSTNSPTPLPVFNGEAKKSDSLMTCAFVKGAEVDIAATTSDGHILRLPASDVREGDRRFEEKTAYWHNCFDKAYGDGSPLLSPTGVVVGINFRLNDPQAARYTSVRYSQKVALAVPSSKIVDYVTQQLPDFQPATTLQSGVNQIIASNSLVLLETKAMRVIEKLPRIPIPNVAVSANPNLREPHDFHAFEDRTCLACVGSRFLKCPDRDCKNGSYVTYVQVPSVQYINGRPVTIFKNTKKRTPCRTCGGNKTVTCAYSQYETDPRFEQQTPRFKR